MRMGALYVPQWVTCQKSQDDSIHLPPKFDEEHVTTSAERMEFGTWNSFGYETRIRTRAYRVIAALKHKRRCGNPHHTSRC